MNKLSHLLDANREVMRWDGHDFVYVAWNFLNMQDLKGFLIMVYGLRFNGCGIVAQFRLCGS